MPHIVVEYSHNIENLVKSENITKQLHAVVVDSGLFSPDAVKARAIGYHDYILPNGAENFVHVTTSILSGRTVEQRLELNASIFTCLKKLLPNVDKLSCDMREMDAQTYRK